MKISFSFSALEEMLSFRPGASCLREAEHRHSEKPGNNI
jgi:hypothetical protein